MIQNLLFSIAFFAAVLYVFKRLFASTPYQGAGARMMAEALGPSNVVHVHDKQEFDSFITQVAFLVLLHERCGLT